jgi:hypothetical protein
VVTMILWGGSGTHPRLRSREPYSEAVLAAGRQGHRVADRPPCRALGGRQRTGRITRGDEVFTLTENQSTCIPLGVKHRLEHPARLPLELIEVQSGSYLGEDDIVRFEDVYGRG